MTVVLPTMTDAQAQAWQTLLKLTPDFGTAWCLVGGQMVHLFCAERGVTPNRPTEDADTVLDVRTRPDILAGFTRALIGMGWHSAGESLEGHQHRWLKDGAQIDVLIPAHVGERAAKRRGATGGTTVQTPGGLQALERTELVAVDVRGEVGEIPRPNLAGALVIKAAAYTNPQDSFPDRHLSDSAVLSALIQRSDALGAAFGPRDLRYLRATVAALTNRADLVAQIDGADRGIDVLSRIITSS